MADLNGDHLEATLRKALPSDLQSRASELATAILHALRDRSTGPGDPSLRSILQTVRGEEVRIGGSVINFGTGNQIGGIQIRDIAGGDIINLTLTLPAPEPWRIAPEDAHPDLCPYPGLAVFERENAAYFFGRDADISRLLQQANRPIVAVTGPSGVGKSSFVLAGVLPRLRDQDATLTAITFRVSTSADLLRDLAVTLGSPAGRPAEELLAALKTHDAALREILLGLTPGGRVVLVLDQFEELFVGADKTRAADRARLLDLLLDIERQADPRLLVILTSRENYFEHPDYRARPDLRPIIQQRNVALDGLNDAQLREAILRPLEALNAQPGRRAQPPIMFESGVIDLIEQEFRRTERTLPLVQYLLRLLWTEQRELSKSAYVTLGGLERALDRHASKIYESFNADDQQLVRAVLLALVRPGIDGEYTRRRVAREDLIGGGAQHDRIAAVVGRLARQDSRIISEQQVGQHTYFELTHEILLRQWERLRVLIDTSRRQLELRERLLPLAEQWHISLERTNGKGDTAHLYRGSQFSQAKDYIERSDVPEGVDTGIKACFQASARYRRQQRITSALGGVALLAVIGVGVVWFNLQIAAEQERTSQRATAQAQAEQTAQAEAVQRATAEALADLESERATRESKIASSQRLANQARQILNQGNRPLAVTLALAANSITDPPLQAQLALAEVAYAPGYVGELPMNPVPETPECVFNTTVGMRTIRVNGQRTEWVFELYDPDRNVSIQSIQLNAINGNPTSTSSELWSLPKWCDQISIDGRYALIGLSIPNVVPGGQGVIDGELVLWDLTSGEQLRSFSNFAGQAFFSPDGSRFAYAALDDSIHIWDIASDMERTSASRARLPFFWSPNSDILLASGAEANEVAAFSIDTFGASEFIRWSGAGTPLGFAPDGLSVYVENGSFQEWSLSNAAQMSGLRGNTPIQAGFLSGMIWFRFSEIAERALSFSIGSDSGTALISNKEDVSQFESITVPGNEFGLSYTFPAMSDDGSTALVGTTEGIYRVDLVTDQVSPLPPISERPGFSQMTLSANGKRAAISINPADSRVALVELESGTLLRIIEEPDRILRTFKLNPDGSQLVIMHAESDAPAAALQLSMWNIESGERMYDFDLGYGRLVRNEAGLIDPSAHLLFSSDGASLLAGIANESLMLLEATTGNELWSVPATGGMIAFSPAGDIVANGQNDDGPVSLIDAKTGMVLTTLSNAAGPMAFSPDGTLIATAGSDRLLHVFDVASGEEIRRFDDTPLQIAFHPDGKSLFTSGRVGVRRWRIDTLDELIVWTRANRQAAGLSCEDRVLYQVPPLCDATSVEPTSAPLVQREPSTAEPTSIASPTATNAPTASPRLATPTVIPPAAAQGTKYRTIATSDGFVAVRERPTRSSREVQRLTAGTEVVCTETVVGEAIAGSNSWAYCPSVGGYIFLPLLTP